VPPRIRRRIVPPAAGRPPRPCCSGRSRREHRASARGPHRPVREPVGRIVRADDEARPDDQRAFAEHLLHRALAERLERPVVLEFGAELLDCLVRHRPERARLGRRLRQVGVDRDGRDEGVVRDRVRERAGRGADDAREVAGRVDRRVPGAAFERRQVSVAVAVELLDLRKEVRVRLPAVEERDLVPAGERVLGESSPEEPGATEDQKADSSSSSRSTSAAVL
jgi:hypothetical protein